MNKISVYSPVAADVSADDTVCAAAVAQNSGASAISKQHASIAIRPVSYGGQFVGADHKDSVVGMRRNKLLRDLQGKEEACTGCGNIETSGAGCSDLLLNEAGRGWEQHVGSGRCHDDEVDLFCRNLRLFECLERRLGRHIASVFIFCGNAAFFNAGASGYPIVAGVDYAREVRVGQDLFRHITACADNRDRPQRFIGARVRARLSFHSNGESPRRYAGLPAVQWTPPPLAVRS